MTEITSGSAIQELERLIRLEYDKYKYAYEKNLKVLFYLDEKYRNDTGKDSDVLWERPGHSGLTEWWIKDSSTGHD